MEHRRSNILSVRPNKTERGEEKQNIIGRKLNKLETGEEIT
jgi:hypothetical protein